MRTQSSVAVSAEGREWFLVNASPDLRAQIEAFPPLQPSPDSVRNSPIAGVLLTNADLDHVLGLFLLREAPRLRVIAAASIMETLAVDLRLTDLLRPFCKIEHYQPAAEGFAPLPASGGGLQFRALPLASAPPPYSSQPAESGIQSVAYEIVDPQPRGRLVVAPDVAAITPALQQAMETADAVLFDGTFWSNEEFQQITGKARTAEDMGHHVIRDGSLNILRGLKAPRKIYFHLNNTNPVLDPASAERAEVERAGVTIGHDGLEFDL